MSNNVKEISEKAIPILHRAGVKKAAIFGSFARGEERKDSDIDLLIDFPEGKSLLDFIGLQNELEESLGRSVDLGEVGTLKPRLRPYVAREQIKILWNATSVFI